MATEKCVDCLPGILSKSKSTISEPICSDCGDYEVDCNGQVTLTPCVVSNITLPCLDLDAGVSQTVVNLAIDTKLCQLSTNCTVSVSSDDTCCGYLGDKIVGGNGITVTTVDAAGCQTISLSESCFTWNPVTVAGTSTTGSFLNNWRNLRGIAPYQVAQFSNVKGCIVRLGGQVVKDLNSSTCLNSTIFILPVLQRPTSIRVFSVVLFQPPTNSACSTFEAGWITIATTGEVTVQSSHQNPTTPTTVTGLNGNWYLSLDGISFETD